MCVGDNWTFNHDELQNRIEKQQKKAPNSRLTLEMYIQVKFVSILHAVSDCWNFAKIYLEE